MFIRFWHFRILRLLLISKQKVRGNCGVRGFREGSDDIRKRGEMSVLHYLPDIPAYPLRREGSLRNRQEQKAP
jgi:hypothetical protein